MEHIYVIMAGLTAIILFVFGLENFSAEIEQTSGERFRRFLARATKIPANRRTHIAVLNHLRANVYCINLGNWKYFFCRMPLTNRSLICSKQVVHSAWVRTKVLPFKPDVLDRIFLRCIGGQSRTAYLPLMGR